jgi:hypothetical protein
MPSATNLKSKIFRHLSNLPGWRTNRKIVVFESDDWGSIRMPSKEEFNNLLKAGIRVDKDHYNRFDALESNADLEALFEVISGFKDKNGNHPAFTGVCVVANPDFEKIKASGFKEYFYESFSETLKRYPTHDRVLDLWKEGAEKRLFLPQFHGREHLNVQRWLRDLQTGNPHTLLAFENRLWGIYSPLIRFEYQAAFDIDTPEDLPYMHEVLKEGVELFKNILGYQPTFFVPTNGPFNLALEKTLHENGIRYIMLDKLQKEPLGSGKYKSHIRWLGKKNKFGQIALSRNGAFEPAAGSKDWVDSCLKDIEIAFRMKKPATISTHRVNYIGFLETGNRNQNLNLLKILIQTIIKKWPEVEFMTSPELGQIIEPGK